MQAFFHSGFPRGGTVHSAHPHQHNPPLHQRHKLNICVRKEHLKCLHLGIFIPAAIYNIYNIYILSIRLD